MTDNPKTTVYIAGKMKGVPYYNFPAFDEAAGMLRSAGYSVINPADLDRAVGFDPAGLPEDHDWSSVPEGFDFDACVTRDIEAVRVCDEIFMLKGWETSRGAKAEKALAEWLGKEVMYEFVVPEEDRDAAWKAFLCPPVSQDKLKLAPEQTDTPPQQARPWGEFPDTVLPPDSKSRLDYPMCSGLLMYFPRACAAVARHSKVGNDQHNPGEPLHWAKEKSIGRGDQIVRHLVDGMTTWEGDWEEAAEHFAGMHWRAAELHERFLEGLPPFERGK